MNPSTASTIARQAVPPSTQPPAEHRDTERSEAAPAIGERNPAHTDDSPDAILGYN